MFKEFKGIKIAAISLVSILLVGFLGFLYLESTWAKPVFRTPQDAFIHGTIGTELAPLPVFQVLPDLFPDQFQPAGEAAGDWTQQFGFIKSKPGENEGLPVGFSISNYQPQSGKPSPVRFVGFSCALCHTSKIRRTPEDQGVIVTGMGSTTLDLFAWVDAFKTAILDEKRLTLENIAQAYEAKFQKPLGIIDKTVISFWLSTARSQVTATLPKWDAPYSGKDLRNSELEPIGPARTQPFKELVHFTMDRPGASDKSYSKLPSLYEQKNREWAQYDGSIKDRLSRSVLAAVAAGATPDNLLVPEISHNVTQAIEYTLDLQGPKYAEVFPEQAAKIDPQKVERGRAVYQQNCATCHGYRNQEDNSWIPGELQGQVVPIAAIKTDPERLKYRYYDELPDAVVNYFPEGHPFRPKRENIRPGPAGDTKGYINAPLESVFARAPYLHNGSVLTLAELINLKPRRNIVYRGDNVYDPVNVGLASPDAPDDQHYFKLDTSVKGNSNQGHDYPWPYHGTGWDKAALEDLLEYLKTL
ncbi:hypothetical protein Nos7524_1678 [Nostoc sp. PCC 7524]|uniref:c-type cytochrome n=1 Tax=Nostoc sp. (strain ATCC 29411 / PCC 7524) TaxID=28072 RepID=UPI00029F226C|nr:c-type cytochrome [Nostoc sp. PCC 7524]AFY47550.1 hypothetical protein Nos7524_1678 [Nostoc sp. PCC 7524]